MTATTPPPLPADLNEGLKRLKMAAMRRLAYLGITRARERLYLTRARRRFMFGQQRGNPASRFLRDLPEEDVVARTVTRWRRSIPPQAGPDRAKADTLIDWARDVPGLDLVGSWVHGTGLAAVVAGVDRTLGADVPPAG